MLAKGLANSLPPASYICVALRNLRFTANGSISPDYNELGHIKHPIQAQLHISLSSSRLVNHRLLDPNSYGQEA